MHFTLLIFYLQFPQIKPQLTSCDLINLNTLMLMLQNKVEGKTSTKVMLIDDCKAFMKISSFQGIILYQISILKVGGEFRDLASST